MMIMSVATGIGLQQKIREKISAFNGQIIVTSFDDNHVTFFATTQALVEALENDLDTPKALAIIDEAFGQIDHAPIDSVHRRSFVRLLEAIDELFALELLDSTPDISDDAKRLIVQRERVRDEKNWQKSDELRDELLEQGIVLRDTPSGTIWTYSNAS
jgi:cysteinyl-tRNA synthetase